MSINPKQLRTIDYHLRSLFSSGAFEPNSFEADKRLGQQYVWHEFRCQGGSLLLTPKGKAVFDGICEVLRSATLVQCTEPSDAVNEFRTVVRDLLSEKRMPENASELVALVTTRLEASRDNFWHVVPVHGLELDGLKSVPLGSLTLERPTVGSLERRGAKIGDKSMVQEMVGDGLCLVGAVYGSYEYARREFKIRADVVIGVLAAIAAVCFEQGANPFRIISETSASGVKAARRGRLGGTTILKCVGHAASWATRISGSIPSWLHFCKTQAT